MWRWIYAERHQLYWYVYTIKFGNWTAEKFICNERKRNVPEQIFRIDLQYGWIEQCLATKLKNFGALYSVCVDDIIILNVNIVLSH
jgi:hypothetical protein